jgi:hypothetical protein
MNATTPSDPLVATDQPPVGDATSAWLAAYALGLTYSSRPQQQRLACLREAAHPHPGGLEAARLRLQTAEVAEPASQQQALHLLEHAMASPTQPVSPLGGARRQGPA